MNPRSFGRLVFLTISAAGVFLRPAPGLEIVVSANKYARTQTPVRMLLEVPEAQARSGSVELIGNEGTRTVGQLTRPSLLSRNTTEMTRELHFILPALAANQTIRMEVQFLESAPELAAFAWTDQAGKYADLRYGQRPVLRYMYEGLDNSTPERRGETCKVYHHMYDPRGKMLVTKGPGGLFPHHRGLFYGFNRIRYEQGGEQRTADVWHCNRGEWQSHESLLETEAGPVLGRHRLAIAWHGQDAKVFAEETREVTAFHSPQGVYIEFASKLETPLANVRLDGDPQHAGFQFRASQEVPDKTRAETFYIRPDGKDQPGQFRNWPQQSEHVNLPWNAMCFVLAGKRFTCCYLDHPSNPHERRFSERDYGRFGSYFEYELTRRKPLEVRYRVYLQEGEMAVETIQRLSDDFANPVAVHAE